ncbi:hypothetical protein ACFOLJ_30220 [Rugamonas sp. CCM 8940]|uniref:hypothetical protein n=1 Tax=Rugamonas sp. CCM 8940 TaxID=2765359 RepID=UPI0018F57A93|nr:hypothetical protein [Rugamonas sp. CCM 8940]MBJ7313102.1 hypothetical protein [Rugamonas sp. CCM 8940]
MKPSQRPNDTPASDQRPAPAGGNFLDEPDIGSGEKTPGERDTEEHIRRIPPLPKSTADTPPPLRS